MGIPLKKDEDRFTYKNYLTWPENERWELIGGIAYDMTPAPSRFHQQLLTNLIVPIGSYLAGKECKVFAAPFDVRFAEKNTRDEEIDTVVQPDIVVVREKSKLDDRGCVGAPDLVIEILSPATAAKDMKEKFALYEKHGVLEYWLVQPLDKTVMVFRSGEDKKYGKPGIYISEDEIKVGIFDDLTIDLKAVFKD